MSGLEFSYFVDGPFHQGAGLTQRFGAEMDGPTPSAGEPSAGRAWGEMRMLASRASRLAVAVPVLGATFWLLGTNPVDWFCRLLRRLRGACTFERVAKLRAGGLSTMSTKSKDSATGALDTSPSEPGGDAPPKDSSTFRPPQLAVITTARQPEPALTPSKPTPPDASSTFSPLSVVPAALDDVTAPSGDVSSLRRRRPSVDGIKTHRERRMSRSRDLSHDFSIMTSDRPEPVSSSIADIGDAASFWGCRLSVASTECEPGRVEVKSDRVIDASLAPKPIASPGRLRRPEVSAGHVFHAANAARDAHARNGRGAEGSQSVDSVGSLTSPNRLRRPEVSAGHDVHEANAALDARSRRSSRTDSPTYLRFISPLASLQAHSTPSAAALTPAPLSPPSAAAQVERRRCLQRALHANPVFGTVSEEQLDELCPRMEVGPTLTLTLIPTPSPSPDPNPVWRCGTCARARQPSSRARRATPSTSYSAAPSRSSSSRDLRHTPRRRRE